MLAITMSPAYASEYPHCEPDRMMAIMGEHSSQDCMTFLGAAMQNDQDVTADARWCDCVLEIGNPDDFASSDVDCIPRPSGSVTVRREWEICRNLAD